MKFRVVLDFVVPACFAAREVHGAIQHPNDLIYSIGIALWLAWLAYNAATWKP